MSRVREARGSRTRLTLSFFGHAGRLLTCGESGVEERLRVCTVVFHPFVPGAFGGAFPNQPLGRREVGHLLCVLTLHVSPRLVVGLDHVCSELLLEVGRS